MPMYADVTVPTAFLVIAILAILVQPLAIEMLLGDRGIDPAGAIVGVDPILTLLGGGGFVLFAVLAGVRQARVAAAIPPVDALRTVPGAEPRRRQVGRWVGAILLVFIGSKLFIADLLGWDKFPPNVSLAITLGILGCGIGASLLKTRNEPVPPVAAKN